MSTSANGDAVLVAGRHAIILKLHGVLPTGYCKQRVHNAHLPHVLALTVRSARCRSIRIVDIQRIVANDTVAVIDELKKLDNTRYHDRPVSLYGGMVELPLIVTRNDSRQWFPDDASLHQCPVYATGDAS